MRLNIIQESILKVKTDAIVNPANPQLLRGGGLSGIIHEAAGDELFEHLKKWKRDNGIPALQHGQAIISPSFSLPHEHIIHAVGAVWREGSDEEKQTLTDCYLACLNLADKNNISSIAFPNISTGIYGFPKEVAAPIAINAAKSYKGYSIKLIVFACYDQVNYNLYKEILSV